MNYQEVLAANCKRLRLDKKMSQPAVATAAKKAGHKIDQKTVSRMEKVEVDPSEKKENPTLSKIVAVAAGLSIPPWRLLMPENVTQFDLKADDPRRKVLTLLDGLNEDGLAALIDQAEFIASKEKFSVSRKRLKS